MIGDWRAHFGVGDFPFYIVQLAAWQQSGKEPRENDSAELREAQALTAQKVPHCGLAVAIDIGDARDIHPKDKLDVGRRLALCALANTYGKPIEWSGPWYEAMEAAGKGIRVRFAHAGGGLVAKEGKLQGFAIAGGTASSSGPRRRSRVMRCWCPRPWWPIRWRSAMPGTSIRCATSSTRRACPACRSAPTIGRRSPRRTSEPPRTGRSIKPASKPNLNTDRVHWISFPNRTGPHCPLTDLRSRSKSSAARSITSRSSPKVSPARHVAYNSPKCWPA